MSHDHIADVMSVDAWARLPEDEQGELVDGQLVEEEMPDAAHETVVVFLIRVFGAWLAGRGFVLSSGVKYALAPKHGRKPDLSVFLPGGVVPPRRGPVAHPPDIAVEVVSSSPEDRRRDRVKKLREYGAFGVRFYWLIDPEARTLEVLELGRDTHYTHVLDAEQGTIDVPGCAGMQLDLDALWQEIARLDPGDEG